MTTKLANQFSGIEAIKIMQKGEKLSCPVCSAILKTVPENWEIGMPFYGIECPNDQHHFMIHCDDADRVLAMREHIKALLKK